MGAKPEFLSYKGYLGSAEVSIEDRRLCGQVMFISDLIVYDAKTFDELEKAFKANVDDYLKLCKEVGKAPEKPQPDRAHFAGEMVIAGTSSSFSPTDTFSFPSVEAQGVSGVWANMLNPVVTGAVIRGNRNSIDSYVLDDQGNIIEYNEGCGVAGTFDFEVNAEQVFSSNVQEVRLENIENEMGKAA